MASSWVAICLMFCFCSQLAWAQEPKTYTVGDATGWTYINASSGKPADYPGWASQYQFFVKDVLKFNYEPNKQNIYLFPKKESWDSCNLAEGTLLDPGTAGTSEWILPIEGYYNFASGIYCDKGQKFRFLAVNNVGSGGVEAPIPASSPSKHAPVSTPKSPSSSPSLAPASSGSIPQAPSSGPSQGFTSASAPATWTQTLILAATGVAAATMLKL